MQCNCFCLNEKDKGRQIIFVYPDEDCFNLPSVTELAKFFAIRGRGRRLKDLRDLPVSVNELKSIAGVHLENVDFGDKELVVLYAVKSLTKNTKIADSVLAGLQVRAELEDEQLWPENNDDLRVISFDFFRYHKVFSLLMLVKSGTRVSLLPTLSIKTCFLGKEFELYEEQQQEIADSYHIN